MTLMTVGRSFSMSYAESLYVSRMGTASLTEGTGATNDAAETPAVPAETTNVSYASSMEMSLEFSVRMQLQQTTVVQDPAFQPEPRAVPADTEVEEHEEHEGVEGRRHGRGSPEHFGRMFSHMGRGIGKMLRSITRELDLDDDARAELKDMVKDLKHDLKDAFRRVEDDDDHDHREHSYRPDAETAFAAAADAFAAFSERLAAFSASLGGATEPEEAPVIAEPVPSPEPAPVDTSVKDRFEMV